MPAHGATGPTLDDLFGWRRVATPQALLRAPRDPGVYAWWARDPEAAELLGLSQAGANLPLYVGMAHSDLARRLWAHSAVHDNGAETEFRTRCHEWIALAMGLAPWHIQQLADFDDARRWGDSLLFGWAHQAAARFMDRFLSVSWTTAPDAARARTWEARLIRDIRPNMNVSGAQVRLRDADWLEARYRGRALAQQAGVFSCQWLVELLDTQPEALAAARCGEIVVGGLTGDAPFWSADADDDDDRWELSVDLRDELAIESMACMSDLLTAPQARALYGPGPSPERIAASMSRFEREIAYLWGTCRTMHLDGERASSPHDLPTERSAR